MNKNDSSKVLERPGHGASPPNPDTQKHGMPGREMRHASQDTKRTESVPQHALSPPTDLYDQHILSRMLKDRIQETPIAGRISAMEKRLEDQESSIKELESKINSVLQKDHVEPVLEHTKKIFAGLEYITQVHYVVLHDRDLHMVFIHSLDDRVEALTSICKNVREIMDVFPDTEVTPTILHKDEVCRDHLIGTTPVFEKMQESD